MNMNAGLGNFELMQKEVSMKVRLFLLIMGLSLGIASSTGTRPVSAQDLAGGTCSGVDYYIYNAIDTEIYIDLANWTIHDHLAMAYMGLGDALRLHAPGGVIDFYVDLMDIPYQLGDWRFVEECSKIAYYIKLVNGVPVLRVKEIPTTE
jgi:hypothetical protein